MTQNTMSPRWGSVIVFIFTQHSRAGLNNFAPLHPSNRNSGGCWGAPVLALGCS
jgi:hypothetical protein